MEGPFSRAAERPFLKGLLSSRIWHARPSMTFMGIANPDAWHDMGRETRRSPLGVLNQQHEKVGLDLMGRGFA